MSSGKKEAPSSRTICPECGGNGYTKIPHHVYADQFSVQQCEKCSSQGEIDEKI
jgi:DnaJ-class molecular chaperone